MSDLVQTEMDVSLPREKLDEIAAIASVSALEKQCAAVNAKRERLAQEEDALAASMQTVRAEADAIREKIARLEEKCAKKEEALAKLEEKRRGIQTCAAQAELELAELEKQRSRLDAKRIFNAFLTSGKSMQEVLDFLGWTEEPPEDTAADDAEPEPAAHQEETPVIPPTRPRRTRTNAKHCLTPEMEEEFQQLWQQISAAQGEEFHTARGLPFRYEVRGRQLFVDRKEKPISESSLKIAYARFKSGQADGPKALQTFGAPYIWSIFKQLIPPQAPDASEQGKA